MRSEQKISAAAPARISNALFSVINMSSISYANQTLNNQTRKKSDLRYVTLKVATNNFVGRWKLSTYAAPVFVSQNIKKWKKKFQLQFFSLFLMSAKVGLTVAL